MERHNCSSDLTFTKDNVSPFHLKVIISILCTLSPVIFITNILLIFLLSQTKQIKLITNYFVLCMSISDTCIGGVVLPLAIVYYGFLSYSKTIEVFLYFVANLLIHLSGLMVLAVALDRYLHIINLTSNGQVCLSHMKAKIILVASFNISLGYAFSMSWMLYHENTKWLILGRSIYGCIFVLLTGLIYIRLYCRVRRSTAEINVDSHNLRHRLPRHVVFLTKTVMIILLSLVCCYLPTLTVGLIVFSHSQGICSDKTIARLYSSFNSFMYVYAAVNALIIMIRNRPMMTYLRDKLKLCQTVTNIEEHPSRNE